MGAKMENKITFDFTPANRVGKEDYEWLRCWCEEVNDTSLPRVALVGDSITEGYFGLVRAGLKVWRRSITLPLLTP